ncbi:MAG: hypothetical protein R2847_10075 [Bacteroidia bacterium]
MNRKRPMKVFTYTGGKDTMFSYMDSLKYYARILNTGMMSVNPLTGEIKAYVGGISHDYLYKDHMAIQKTSRFNL